MATVLTLRPKMILAAAVLRLGHDRPAEVPDQAGVLVDLGLGIEVIVDGDEVLVLVLRLLGDVDAPQMAHAVAVVGLPAGGDIELVVPDHGSGDDEAGACRVRPV